MGHGACYNVRNCGSARILCCTIEVHPLRMMTHIEMEGNEPKVIDDVMAQLTQCLYTCYSLRGMQGHKPVYYQELGRAATIINIVRGHLARAKRFTKCENINQKLKAILNHDTK